MPTARKGSRRRRASLPENVEDREARERAYYHIGRAVSDYRSRRKQKTDGALDKTLWAAWGVSAATFYALFQPDPKDPSTPKAKAIPDLPLLRHIARDTGCSFDYLLGVSDVESPLAEQLAAAIQARLRTRVPPPTLDDGSPGAWFVAGARALDLVVEQYVAAATRQIALLREHGHRVEQVDALNDAVDQLLSKIRRLNHRAAMSAPNSVVQRLSETLLANAGKLLAIGQQISAADKSPTDLAAVMESHGLVYADTKALAAIK